jgi:hypothetical protein
LELASKNVELATNIIVEDEKEEWDVEEVLDLRIIDKG